MDDKQITQRKGRVSFEYDADKNGNVDKYLRLNMYFEASNIESEKAVNKAIEVLCITIAKSIENEDNTNKN